MEKISPENQKFIDFIKENNLDLSIKSSLIHVNPKIQESLNLIVESIGAKYSNMISVRLKEESKEEKKLAE